MSGVFVWFRGRFVKLENQQQAAELLRQAYTDLQPPEAPPAETTAESKDGVVVRACSLPEGGTE